MRDDVVNHGVHYWGLTVDLNSHVTNNGNTSLIVLCPHAKSIWNSLNNIQTNILNAWRSLRKFITHMPPERRDTAG